MVQVRKREGNYVSGKNHHSYSGGLKSLKTEDDALDKSAEDQKLLLASIMGKIVKDDVTGCWEWQRGKNADGYARSSGNMVSRLVYVLINQKRLGALKALHRCDNPGCVNPEHIFAGTQRDNVIDMIAKGRNGHIKGEKHYSAKLTEEKVREIRALRKSGVGYAQIAKRYGVSKPSITAIFSGKNWKGVQ